MHTTQYWVFKILVGEENVITDIIMFEIDTKKQRQHRRGNVMLTESGNTRSRQLLMIPTKSENVCQESS